MPISVPILTESGQQILTEAGQPIYTEGTSGVVTRKKFLPFILSTAGLTEAEWAQGFVAVMLPSLSLPTFQGDFQGWAAQVLQEPQLAPYALPTNIHEPLAWADAVNAALATGAH